MILEELRLNCEDLHELSKQARERAIRMREENRVLSEAARARRRRLGKKR